MSSIIKEGEDKLDLDSGYFTREAFTVGSEACDKFLDTVPQLISDTKKVEDGREWYLTTITLPGGILFPDGTPDEYKWVVAPVVDIDIDDKDKYPVPGESEKTYSTRVAVEEAKQFSKFKEGLVYLGML